MKKKIAKAVNNHYIAKCNYIEYYEKYEIDDKTILLEASQGKVFGGNIYYLAKELLSNPAYKEYTVYFAVNKDKMAEAVQFYERKNMDKIVFIEMMSKKYFQVISYAKYLISDTGFYPFFIKKEGQVYLNTWHGTPLKHLGKKINDNFHDIGNVQKNFICSDYLLFPNHYTKEHMVEDYMLNNLSNAQILLEGYPRNTAFFDDDLKKEIIERYNLQEKQIIAYMPTWRETSNAGKSVNKANLSYILGEFENRLNENQLIYVNLHPIDAIDVDFRLYKKVKPFPVEYETYEFLNAADVLVTDYSSVFFDFLNTHKKIILYTYDKEAYLAKRGLYRSLDDFPFPIVEKMDDLISEINKCKEYCDDQLNKEFCTWDSKDSAKKICARVILENKGEIKEETISDNQKENVFIFVGRLESNGITTSLKNLIKTIDLEKRNYYLIFDSRAVKKNKDNLKELNQFVGYLPFKGKMNLTLMQKKSMFLYKYKKITTEKYMAELSNIYQHELKRLFGTARVDTIIHFTGYGDKKINLFSQFRGNKVIYVHANMLEEMTLRNNQRRDVLSYAYKKYDKVAIVSEDIKQPTFEISGRSDNIRICRNIINNQNILTKGAEKLAIEESTIVFPNPHILFERLESNSVKFINVGRFSPEKGQIRLLKSFEKIHRKNPDTMLFIVGGSSYKNYYEEVIECIKELKLEDSVTLVKNMRNPFPLLKRMDALVLSSFAEGFGLVVVEADVLSKPVVSVDILGPKGFIEENGGYLCENSEEGLYKGMEDYLNGKVKCMGVDYDEYNRDALLEFESLFE